MKALQQRKAGATREKIEGVTSNRTEIGQHLRPLSPAQSPKWKATQRYFRKHGASSRAKSGVSAASRIVLADQGGKTTSGSDREGLLWRLSHSSPTVDGHLVDKRASDHTAKRSTSLPPWRNRWPGLSCTIHTGTQTPWRCTVKISGAHRQNFWR